MYRRLLRIAALVLCALLVASTPSAFAATRTFRHPQTADSGAYFMQTHKLVVRNASRTVTVTAYGTYYWRYIDRVDLSLTTPGYARCYDLRSTTPHRAGQQRPRLYGSHCGDFHVATCRGARIQADPNHRFIRFTVPQSCIGRPRKLKGSLSFEDMTAGLYNQSDFGLVRRG